MKKSNFVHILSPGHGGIDPLTGEYVTKGKRSPVWSDGSQYFEGQGNREIAKLVVKQLEELGYDYAFTVDPDDHRDMSLSRRAAKANSIQAIRPTITWSIHSNGYKKESANGFEVFTSPGQTKSDFIADVLFREAAKEFRELRPRKDEKDGDLDKEAKFTILTKTKGRAVLYESMFHTNEKECRILMSDSGKQRVANVIVRAIIRVEELANSGEIKP